MKTLKLRTCDVCITADTHFGHKNIIKYCHRPFLSTEDETELARRGGRWHSGAWKDGAPWKISDASVQIMEDHLVEQINRIMQNRTHLIIAGDFSMYGHDLDAYWDRVSCILRRIECSQKHIVWGNHDHPTVSELFTTSQEALKIELTDRLNQTIIVSHYCQAIWDKQHRGSWHAYGHSHSEAEEMLNEIMPGRRSIDVGVDNAKKILCDYRPFKMEEICDIMSNRPGFRFSKHAPLNLTESESPSESESLE